IAKRIDLVALEDLGRNIRKRTEHPTLPRPPRFELAEDSCYSEVHDFGRTIAQNHDVGRLDIPMKNTLVMGVLQALCYLSHHRSLVKEGREVPGGKTGDEVFALKVFHH